jgi:hypothetical protein
MYGGDVTCWYNACGLKLFVYVYIYICACGLNLILCHDAVKI